MSRLLGRLRNNRIGPSNPPELAYIDRELNLAPLAPPGELERSVTRNTAVWKVPDIDCEPRRN